MAADAVAVLDAAGVSSTYVYGHSMGGMIAQAIAASWPDRVRRLLFEATSPSAAAAMATTNASTCPEAERWRHPVHGGRRRQSATRSLRSGRERSGVLLALPGAPPVIYEMAQVYASTRGPSRRTLRWQRGAVLAFDNCSRLGQITAPALVVHPGEDLVPEESARAFADSLGNGQLRVLPGVGHDVRWAAPALCVELISDFLVGEPVSVEARQRSRVEGKT